MAPYLPVPTSYPRLDMRLISALISYHLQVTSTGVSMVSRYHLERELTVIPRHTGTQPPTGSFTFAEQLIHVCTSMYVYARTESGRVRFEPHQVSYGSAGLAGNKHRYEPVEISARFDPG
jgi:hypothetical protein